MLPSMASRTSIEWTDATWNPTTGCDRISPGCDNCYALRLAGRLKAMGSAHYQSDGDERTSGPGFGLSSHADILDLPRTWRAGRQVFVNSMSDLFHNDVPIDYVHQVFTVMAETPRHTYQILTKRSKRLMELAPELDWPPNVWMGVSVESPAFTFRVNHLRSTPARLKFVSFEPLLDALGTVDLRDISWVIVGGESGRDARPLHVDWVRDIRDQCLAADVRFFFKQWGGRTAKAGGRLLDNRYWDERPTCLVPGPG